MELIEFRHNEDVGAVVKTRDYGLEHLRSEEVPRRRPRPSNR